MKRRSTKLSLLFILLISFLFLTSCNIPTSNLDDRIAIGVAQTNVVQTQAAADKNSAAPPSGNAPEAPAPPEPEQPPQSPLEPSLTHTITWTPTLTLTSTITPTITLSVPMVSVSENTNCRKGPGQAYKILGALLSGETAEVVGRSADGQNWIIKNPDGAGECWLWAYYASVSGPIDSLPVYTPPPQFDWSGNWTTHIGDVDLFSFPLSASVNGKNYSAVLDLGGGDVGKLQGTINDDYLSVSGTWTDPIGNTVPFKFYALGDNQFQGNDDGTWAWCGNRAGASQPNPCLKP